MICIKMRIRCSGHVRHTRPGSAKVFTIERKCGLSTRDWWNLKTADTREISTTSYRTLVAGPYHALHTSGKRRRSSLFRFPYIEGSTMALFINLNIRIKSSFGSLSTSEALRCKESQRIRIIHNFLTSLIFQGSRKCLNRVLLIAAWMLLAEPNILAMSIMDVGKHYAALRPNIVLHYSKGGQRKPVASVPLFWPGAFTLFKIKIDRRRMQTPTEFRFRHSSKKSILFVSIINNIQK